MPTYRAPLDEFRFLLHEVHGAHQLTALPTYGDCTADLMDSVLEEGAKFCQEVLFPLNMSGDAEGCSFQNGEVRTPKGFREAYQAYVAGGWPSLAAHPEHGGQGLPVTLRIAVDEMLLATNLSFAMYPGLTIGAYETLEAHGEESLGNQYLPKLASGEWTGTMCLTEAHAGTDLGMIRTKAIPRDDGSYALTGTKIFITAGEHDLAPNIVHLVLAKLPDAPAGTRGISLFLVPKFLPDAAGNPGLRNGVRCGNIEHKMGIKGSATCVLNFDEARGWLVGEPHKGMKAMFTMMNGARINVGLQGLGIAEASYQSAVAYARERVQGRVLSGTKSPNLPADPIINHPEIRRALLSMRASIEAERALALWTAMRVDESMHASDPTRREEANDLVALLTPIIKALFTDLGFESANVGLQVFGGHGYIREFGMEQFVRDARISQIYEGTNYVQALDLVGRKLPEGQGRLFKRFVSRCEQDLDAAAGPTALADIVAPVRKALDRLVSATESLGTRAASNVDEAGAVASDYLRLFGLTALGWMWVRMAATAHQRTSGGMLPATFYAQKLKTARYFITRILPQTEALAATLAAGGASVLAVDPADF